MFTGSTAEQRAILIVTLHCSRDTFNWTRLKGIKTILFSFFFRAISFFFLSLNILENLSHLFMFILIIQFSLN